MTYTLDWSASNLNGGNTLSDSGSEPDITATVTRGGDGTGPQDGQFGTSNPTGTNDIPNGTLWSNLVQAGGNDTPFVNIDFGGDEVGNVSFALFDVDAGSTGGYSWDDIVGIQALDANGDPVEVTFTTADGQTVSGPDANGFYYVEGEVQDEAELGSVIVNIAGPVESLTINFTDGPDNSDAGYIGVGDLTFDAYVPPCFVRGTMIATDRGDVAVEDLLDGDMIRTMDNGMQPIRWIGSAKVNAQGSNAPILFREGAIGNTSDLMVSPWHRVMLQSWQVELLFGGEEMLVAANSLVNDSTITRVKSDKVEYFHIMFDQHEIIFSNGAPTESFHPSAVVTGAMGEKSRQEVLELFPELKANTGAYGPVARATLAANEAALLSI